MADRPRKIAFVACSAHQKVLFRHLKGHLPEHFSADVIDANALPPTPRYWSAAANVFRSKAKIDDSVSARIIAFDYGKYLINRPARRAPFDTFIRRLWSGVAKINYRYFLTRFGKDKPDLVVVWGGYRLPVAAAVAAARHLGIATLFCENGLLPRTIVMDPAGINGANTLIGKRADFYRNVEIEPSKLDAIFNVPAIQRPLRTSFLQRLLGNTPQQDKIALPERFVFLPLQVHDDSQIILFSPDFPDMPSLVRYCAQGVRTYNAGNNGTLGLVVKEHPSDNRADYSELYREFPDVAFAKTTNTQQLIGRSSVVATINSTVGIEALVHLKPVIVLGDAFFDVPELTTRARRTESFAAVLEKTLSAPVDHTLVEKFLYYLRYVYLVPFDRRSLGDADTRQPIERIVRAAQSAQDVFSEVS